MSTHKVVTIVGTSPRSFEAAIESGIADAATTLRNLEWFEVQELRGRLQGGAVGEYQVKMQVGFRVET
jgi:flavin-binding protein dodecin